MKKLVPILAMLPAIGIVVIALTTFSSTSLLVLLIIIIATLSLASFFWGLDQLIK